MFLAQSREDFDAITTAIYGSEYQDDLICRSTSPAMTAVCGCSTPTVGWTGKVRLLALGRPLLEEQTPEGIGNYAGILTGPEVNDAALLGKLRAFLEDMHWVGFANFDMKRDPRTGAYKLFEMNPRQGRSSYYVTAAGYNLAEYLVADVLEHEAAGCTVADAESLWMIAPYGVLRRYVQDEDLRRTAARRKKLGPLRAPALLQRGRQLAPPAVVLAQPAQLLPQNRPLLRQQEPAGLIWLNPNSRRLTLKRIIYRGGNRPCVGSPALPNAATRLTRPVPV